MNAPIRFEEFSFHPELGELIQHDALGREHKTRLAPQPCKLLLLLLENHPDIVSQKKIKDTLWPDVHVDYERSLHYCIRQIRSALNDNAANPRFIETIPRKGYRWKVVFEDGNIAPDQNKPASFNNKKGILFALIAILSFLFYFFAPRLQNLGGIPKKDGVELRVAIMPFQPIEESNQFKGNDIAIRLVDILTNNYKESCQIIGPTTTTNYQSRHLRTLAQDFGIDYIINGKFSQARDTSRLLAEIIRAEDGVHVWVKYFPVTISAKTIIEEITTGFQQCATD